MSKITAIAFILDMSIIKHFENKKTLHPTKSVKNIFDRLIVDCYNK